MQINILEYFEKTTAGAPEKTAVIDGERSISFSELMGRAKALAYRLMEACGRKIRQPVAVFLPKSIEIVVSDLGIVYSGNAYMNLDVKTPAQRIGNILTLVQPLYVITDAAHGKLLEAVWPEEKTMLLDDSPLPFSEEEEKTLARNLTRIIDTDPLCLINTSGSTGTPKSVVLNHRSFIDFTDWANATMDFSRNEVMGCLSPAVFDIYSYEMCLMMSRGGTMFILPENLAAFPASILKAVTENQVTFLFWVPTIMVNIANMGLLDKFSFESLKTVWFAGEVFPTKQFNMWRRAMPHVRFVNMYGPIEITLDCTYYIIERELDDSEPIPIGRAMRNTDILLLDDNNQLCAPGEEGELCVRGSSLAMGYYNSPEKTSASFVQNPLNRFYPELIYRTGDIAVINERGELIFRGRKDTLVKHSGYRIELSEIEHVIINTLGLVKNGCAVYDYVKEEIVFFYEAEGEQPLGALRRAIGKALPKYMIPSRFVYTTQLPRNTNGKIDRLKLKEQWNGTK